MKSECMSEEQKLVMKLIRLRWIRLMIIAFALNIHGIIKIYNNLTKEGLIFILIGVWLFLIGVIARKDV
jgi:hypothetical protein